MAATQRGAGCSPQSPTAVRRDAGISQTVVIFMMDAISVQVICNTSTLAHGDLGIWFWQVCGKPMEVLHWPVLMISAGQADPHMKIEIEVSVLKSA